MNSDILLLLVVRMDNETLSKLSRTTLWRSISPLINNHYWYLRSIFLTGYELTSRPDVDWKTIYYALASASEDKRGFSWNRIGKRRGAIQELAYLPSLLVMIELHGAPKWNEDTQETVWRSIPSVDVLHYLLEKEYITIPPEHIIAESIRQCVNRGNVDMIEELLDLLRTVNEGRMSTGLRDSLQDSMEAAIERGNLEIVKILNRREGLGRDHLYAAAREGTGEVLRYLLETFNYSSDELTENIETTLETGNAGTLEVLLEYGADKRELVRSWDKILEKELTHIARLMIDEEIVRVDVEEWEEILEQAVEEDRDEMVTLALKYLPVPTLKRDESLIGRLRAGDRALANDVVFEKIRSSPALSVLHNVESNIELAKQLMKNSDVSKWNRDTVRIFSWALKLVKGDKVRGFENGLIEVIGIYLMYSHPESLSIIEEQSIYSKLLRVLLFEQVKTKKEISHWMELQANTKIQQAAYSIVYNVLPRDREVIPLRALMLSMLYPTMHLDEALLELKREGVVEKKLLKMCAQLIGAYLGASNPLIERSIFDVGERLSRRGSRSNSESNSEEDTTP